MFYRIALVFVMNANLLVAVAQSPRQAPPPPHNPPSASQLTERMTQDLQLNSDQAQRLQQINERHVKEMKQKRTEMEAIHKAHQADLEKVLTPQQMEQYAQQHQPPHDRLHRAHDGDQPKRTPEQRAQAMTDRMSRSLSLNDQQQQQLQRINEQFVQKNEQARQNKSERIAQIKANLAERETALKQLLNAQQYQQHLAQRQRLEDQADERRTDRRGRCNGQRSTTPNQTPPPAPR